MIGNIADFRAYHQDRGNAAPTDATGADATAALIRATDQMEFHYIPRLTVDETSATVIDATYVLAGIELGSPGIFSKVYTEADAKVLTEVNGIKWTLTGSGGADASIPVSTRVEQMLSPLMRVSDFCGVMVV